MAGGVVAERKPGRPGRSLGLDPFEAAGSPEGPPRIPIGRIHPDPHQPRRDFDDGSIAELAGSIKARGIVQPLVPRPDPDSPGNCRIVAGARRWRAARAAGLRMAPAIAENCSDTEAAETTIIGNVQREDLDPMAAAAYRWLMDGFGHTQDRLAEVVGKSRSHTASLLRPLNLPDAVQALARSGRLSAGHARAPVTAENPEAIAREAAGAGLSVRETERRVRNEGGSRSGSPRDRDAGLAQLEHSLALKLGMAVTASPRRDGKTGRLAVAFRSLEEPARLSSLLSRHG